MRRTLRRAGAGLLMAGLALFVAAGTAGASSGGQRVMTPSDNNHGDIWVDVAGNPTPTGHPENPHLTCADINVWADYMANSDGAFQIFSKEPSGDNGELTDQAGTWAYDTEQGGNQVITVLSGQALVNSADAAGATKQENQGYKFKIVVEQNPEKSKVFWVDCDPSTPEGSPTASPTPTETPTATPTETPTGTPTGSAQALTSSPTSTPTGGTKAIVNTPSTGAGPDTVGPLAFLGLLMMIGGAVLVAIGRRRDTANS